MLPSSNGKDGGKKNVMKGATEPDVFGALLGLRTWVVPKPFDQNSRTKNSTNLATDSHTSTKNFGVEKFLAFRENRSQEKTTAEKICQVVSWSMSRIRCRVAVQLH